MRRFFCALLVVGTLVAAVASADEAKDKAIKKDRQRIEGTWQITALEINGNQSKEEDIQKIRVVIVSVETGRTTILDGWGIHMSLRGGWVWNIWGRDCVVLQLRKGILRVGTDDAEKLARFVENKISQK